MPKPVQLYRLFVASPGDCRQERELIRRLAVDWNVAYGYRNGVMLEAALWETHATPGFGSRPQDLINRQVLDTSDIAIGIFKRRLGTPTGAHASGTVEELERFRATKRPTLVYFFEPPRFSSAETDGTSALDEYRARLSADGLIWRYRGQVEFATLIAKHLASTMALLVATPSQAAPQVSRQEPPALVDDALLAAVMQIKSRTTLLWEALCTLAEDQTVLTVGAGAKLPEFGRAETADGLRTAAH